MKILWPFFLLGKMLIFITISLITDLMALFGTRYMEIKLKPENIPHYWWQQLVQWGGYCHNCCLFLLCLCFNNHHFVAPKMSHCHTHSGMSTIFCLCKYVYNTCVSSYHQLPVVSLLIFIKAFCVLNIHHLSLLLISISTLCSALLWISMAM